jgi:RNA polymerase sigma-70 factor (ECF subfamily)
MPPIDVVLAIPRERSGADGDAAWPGADCAEGLPTFDAVYDRYIDFVWRSARRLGVDPASVEDVVQEVFVAVHRKLDAFERRSSLKTWLFSIVLHVIRHHRRTVRRKDAPTVSLVPADLDALPAPGRSGLASAETSDGLRLLDQLLLQLDDEKREVFVLASVEEMTVPEIAEVLGENINTVYSRLRTARREFEQVLSRHRARETRSQR